MPIAAPRPETWIRTTPAGLYCEPGDFYIDPLRPVPRAVITHGHGDHARPGNASCAGNRADDRDHAGALWRAGRRRLAAARLWRDVDDRRGAGAAGAGRPCARQRPDRARLPRQPGRRLRRLQAPAGSDLCAVRAAALRSLHHRGDLWLAGLPPSAGQPGDRQAAAFAFVVSRALPSRRGLCAGQMPAGAGAAAAGRLRGAGLSARCADRADRAVRASRRAAGTGIAGDRA